MANYENTALIAFEDVENALTALLSRWSFSRNTSSEHARAVVARYGLLALAIAKFLPGAMMPSLAGAPGMSKGSKRRVLNADHVFFFRHSSQTGFTIEETFGPAKLIS